jgi:hypothetical protein
MALFLVVLLLGWGMLTMAGGEIRAGRPALDALNDPGGWTANDGRTVTGGNAGVSSAPSLANSNPFSSGGAPAPQTLPRAGASVGEQQAPGPWCHTPPANCAHYRVLGWCSFECVP